jgi:nucleotide-binding universal stress UspA family protein
MYRIIVPIDFSDESLHGLNLALLFVKKFSCKIEMVYVQRKSQDYNPGPKEGELKYAEKEFKKIQETYKDKIPQHSSLVYIIKTGRIYREIVNQANSFKDSFIIASTHGASGFEKFFIGSNAFKIISATSRPVITIRGNELPNDIKTIVLPLDISSDTRQKIPFTTELAKIFNSEIHVVTITSMQTDDISNKLASYSKQVCEYLDGHKIKYKTKALVGSKSTDLVLDYADQVKADLISIMTEQVSDANFILGTAAQEMLNKSSIPLLSINSKELHVSGAFRTQG